MISSFHANLQGDRQKDVQRSGKSDLRGGGKRLQHDALHTILDCVHLLGSSGLALTFDHLTSKVYCCVSFTGFIMARSEIRVAVKCQTFVWLFISCSHHWPGIKC